ncbi:hypothetical protein Tco_0040638 [Tanacetum coccineum]
MCSMAEIKLKSCGDSLDDIFCQRCTYKSCGKARLQDKDTNICKLKDTIKSLRENTKEEKVNPDKCDLEPINKELENSVAKLLSENELKQAKEKQPLDSELDFSCKYATRIQELLVYVQDTCPNVITPSTKTVDVSPMNNVKKVRLLVVSTMSEVDCFYEFVDQSRLGNKKNDKILQTPSKNKKNKVEAQPRKVNNSNRVVKPVCNVDVKHTLSNTNSKILFATCNKSMFDAVHGVCIRRERGVAGRMEMIWLVRIALGVSKGAERLSIIISPDTRVQSGQPVMTREEDDGISVALDPQV